ncbi:MAG TPA: hypothetical protein VFZ53_15690 [Polyangiaceae bacterium]
MSFGTVGFGFSALLCAFSAVSCGGASGDDDGGGGEEGGTSGSSSGGTSGSSTGGTTTGGSSTGGSATGGSSGSATGGSSGDGCMPNPAPQTCSGAPPNMHMPADGGLIDWSSYVVGSGAWGSSNMGDLTGGTSKYNGRDVDPIIVAREDSTLRLTATIPPYTPDDANDAENYAGLVFWFGPCINVSDFTGLTFELGGTLNGAALKFQVQTAENYPADPANTKGACVFESCDTRWTECKGPDTTVTVPATSEPMTFAWEDFMNGAPNAGVNASGLVGLQFQLECQSQEAACAVDITLGSITLTE